MKPYRWVTIIALLAACKDTRPADAARLESLATSTRAAAAAASARSGPQPEDSGLTQVELSSKRYWMRDRIWRDRVELELLDSASTPVLLASMTVRALYDSTVLVRYFCRYPDNPDAIVGAVAVYEDAEVFSKTVAAWEIDTIHGRLVPLDSSRVTCDNGRYEP